MRQYGQRKQYIAQQQKLFFFLFCGCSALLTHLAFGMLLHMEEMRHLVTTLLTDANKRKPEGGRVHQDDHAASVKVTYGFLSHPKAIHVLLEQQERAYIPKGCAGCHQWEDYSKDVSYQKHEEEKYTIASCDSRRIRTQQLFLPIWIFFTLLQEN